MRLGAKLLIVPIFAPLLHAAGEIQSGNLQRREAATLLPIWPKTFGSEARLEGEDRILVTHIAPFCGAAHHPDTALTMRHEGSETESVRAKLGIAAGLTVRDLDDGRSRANTEIATGQLARNIGTGLAQQRGHALDPRPTRKVRPIGIAPN
jgi:hypothetical protein